MACDADPQLEKAMYGYAPTESVTMLRTNAPAIFRKSAALNASLTVARVGALGCTNDAADSTECVR
jgi:hypothetical protein